MFALLLVALFCQFLIIIRNFGKRATLIKHTINDEDVFFNQFKLREANHNIIVGVYTFVVLALCTALELATRF